MIKKLISQPFPTPVQRLLTPAGADSGGRVAFVDVAKGLVMVLVVAYHFDSHGIYWFNYFMMPFFFFAAGMFFSTSDQPRKFVIKKSLRLLVPLLVGCVAGLTYDFLFNKGASFFGHLHAVPFRFYVVNNVPLWFLLCLFYVFMIVYAVHHTVASNKVRIAVFAVLSVVGFLMSQLGIENTLFFGQALLILPFFLVGYYGRRFWLSARWAKPFVLALCVLIVILAVTLLPGDIPNIHRFAFSPYYFPSLLVGFAISLLVLAFCLIMANFRISRPLQLIGVASMTVLIFHYVPIYYFISKLNKIYALPALAPLWSVVPRVFLVLMAAFAVSLVLAGLSTLLHRLFPRVF